MNVLIAPFDEEANFRLRAGIAQQHPAFASELPSSVLRHQPSHFGQTRSSAGLRAKRASFSGPVDIWPGIA